MKKRVYVIYTGGTLGMQKTARGFRPVANWFEQQLRSQALLQQANMPEFSLHEYSPLLDSSDIRPEHWLKIAQDIAAHYHHYDGFVVLHGTDTMAYTAAALQHLFKNLAKPVIVTGAQIPFSEPHSDTLTNVRNALYAAAYSELNEVGLLFHQHILPALYATKYSSESLDGFAAPNAAPLVQWSSPYLQLTESCATQRPLAPALQLHAFTPKRIYVLTIHPGMDFELLAHSLQQPWDGVILYSLGSGNIPQHPLLLESLQALAARGVKLYNCSQCLQGSVSAKYASGYLMAEMGVIASEDKGLEATFAYAQILG